MIDNKWKRFAVSQTLSDWGDIDSSDLFDLMAVEDDAGLEELFDKYEVVVWEPFENWHNIDVAKQIYSLASAAQETSYD